MCSAQVGLAEQKRAAQTFVERWQEMPCKEEEHSRSFWIEFLEILGVNSPTHVLDFERKVRGRKIDIFYEDMGILIEQKGGSVSLDEGTVRSKKAGPETPFKQAKWYADHLPYSIRPRWIITCNFKEFRIYDLEHPEDPYTQVFLSELPEELHLFSFFTDKSNSRLVKEKELSIQAGEVVGSLYKAFAKQYINIETNEQEQRSLNVLIVRIVFLLYAEDAGILQNHQAFGKYMKSFKTEHMRQALIDLFKVLDTPEAERDIYSDPELNAFPYVDGGLFEDEDIIIPQFTDQLRLDLLLNASVQFNWADLSPTIFGAVFESTLNPETRRSGGMHYTSIENIHKVIDPLFLDDLKEELTSIEGERTEKKRVQKLRMFQKKLSELKFLDPAAGSHNFLTETYLSLRKLELRIIEDLQGDQTSFIEDPIMVNIQQLYAIEINDFAVAVGRTALWIAEQQMMEKTQELLPFQSFDFLPLKSFTNSHCANALRVEWNDVIPAEECNYIMGNPPFVGANNQNREQKSDVQRIFCEHHHASLIDYVGCWYKQALTYTKDTLAQCSFVSTNSICQGEQVANLWEPLFNDGLIINFAHRTFRWNSEATDQAHVFVSIIGFAHVDSRKYKRLYYYETPDSEPQLVYANHINAYLVNAPDVFVKRISSPKAKVPKMTKGCQPTDGGNLIIEADDLNDFLSKEPAASKYIKKLIGSREFIQQKPRYCLWLVDTTEQEINSMPLVRERVEACREMRLSSNQEGTRKLASRAATFRETYNPETCLIVPMTSSERRHYIPLGFIGKDTVSTNLNLIIQNASLYQFGIMQSQIHNAWMRVVCGRLKSDYRYSAGVVYNNFPWPQVNQENIDMSIEKAVSASCRVRIESCAQAILDTRALYPDASLADLYDPDKMPHDLLTAHKTLDQAVEEAYGVNFNGDEEKIVAHLFKLYAELTGE